MAKEISINKKQNLPRKQLTPISIKNRTFKINSLHVETIALKHFNTTFQKADDQTKTNIKNYIRDLVKNKEVLSAQIIEDAVFLDFLTKKLQKEVKYLAYLHGL